MAFRVAVSRENNKPRPSRNISHQQFTFENREKPFACSRRCCTSVRAARLPETKSLRRAYTEEPTLALLLTAQSGEQSTFRRRFIATCVGRRRPVATCDACSGLRHRCSRSGCWTYSRRHQLLPRHHCGWTASRRHQLLLRHHCGWTALSRHTMEHHALRPLPTSQHAESTLHFLCEGDAVILHHFGLDRRYLFCFVFLCVAVFGLFEP